MPEQQLTSVKYDTKTGFITIIHPMFGVQVLSPQASCDHCGGKGELARGECPPEFSCKTWILVCPHCRGGRPERRPDFRYPGGKR